MATKGGRFGPPLNYPYRHYRREDRVSSNYGRIERGPMAGDRFTQISNALFRDKRISHKAKGVFGLISTHRDGYGITIEGILRNSKDGRDAIRSALAELEQFGYLERTQQHDDEGKFAGVVYCITDMPAHLYELYGDDAPQLPSRSKARSSSSAPLSDFPSPANPTSEDPDPKKTKPQNTNKQEEPDTAPSARSAGDVRRTTDGSSACEANSGCAATDKPSSAEDGGVKRRGAVPEQRGGDRKPSPFPVEVRQAIYATESLLPGPLRDALSKILPHGHLPNVNRMVTAQALETRTPAELGERAARRWISYGYERDFYDGLLHSPLGVVEELLRPTPFCPLPECEDGRDRHTGMQCSTCEERIEQRKRDRKAGRKVSTTRPTRLYRDREECAHCSRPLSRDAAYGDLCRPCQTQADQELAALHQRLGIPAPPAAPCPAPDPTDAPYAPAPPSAEYREWREQQADDGAPF